ncbi:MAG: peptidase S9 [Bacteroidetes bacterium]|nr:MAG: peptidase S9 [Bacteroidota bacterium]
MLRLLCLLLALTAGELLAQSDAWSVKDLIHQESLSGVYISRDGQKVVWQKRRPAPEKDRFVSDLYLTRLDQEQNGRPLVVQLTRGNDNDYSPLFSATSDTVYFLSSRNKGKQLWAISLYGGAPFAVDSFPNGLSNLQWQNDSTLLLLAQEGKTEYERTLKRKKDDVEVIEDTAHFKPVRLFAYNLKQKTLTRLTDNRFPIQSYAVSFDGRRAVTAHQMSPHAPADGKPAPQYFLWDLETGARQRILQGYQDPGSFRFTSDDGGFYFRATRSSDPEWEGAGISLLYYYELASGETREVPLDHEWGLGGSFVVFGQDVLATLAEGPVNTLAYYLRTEQGWQKRAVEAGERLPHLGLLGVQRAGRKLAYTYSRADRLPSYHIATISLTGKVCLIPEGQEIAQLNPGLAKKPLAKTEVVRWTGALDEEVTGILYYPHDYEEGRRYPLIVGIHGGPSGVDQDRWSDRWAYPHQLIAQRGAFVLKPNYHGSDNHGQAFVESIKGHYYEYELPDILAGIDYLDERGLIDRDSMGVMGWSNGAILTTMLTVQHPDLFKAATPGAGDVNWTSDFGTCQFGVTFDQSYFGGAPWDDRDGQIYNPVYIQKSPLFEMEKVQTPTLIFHGSEDRAVPRDQGWEYYRALQQVGKAPVRFLWFPGQPHGLGKLSHQTRKVEEELRWFDTYLFGTAKPAEEAIKAKSPLMARLNLEKAAADGGRWGIMANKVLLPEVVVAHADSIALGRFEVTQAQFAQYRRRHAYLPTEANHPVTGLSQADIEGYLQWLSEETGDRYRLPTAAEAAALHKAARKAAGSENTLAYWAGYTPTLDEVPALQAKVKEVEGSLLQPAGQHAPSSIGKAKLYDLGGNAAEYYQDADGLKTYGYSAYDFADPAQPAHQSAPAHTGFRVVKVLKP